MKLNYRKIGQGPPLMILHGIFGSADNWQTLGKRFAEQFTVYLIDQRNHGNSPHDQVFTYAAMAQDVEAVISSEGLDQVHLLGHSMGGKVAMEFSLAHPEKLETLIVVDIAPKAYPVHHQELIDAMRSLPLDSIDSRKEADQQLAKSIPNIGIRQFLLKNLTRDEHQEYSWKINLPVIDQQIEAIGEALGEGQYSGPTLFIRGGESGYIKDEDESLIRQHFPEAKLVTIPKAGHWVHAENPDGLYEAVIEFIQSKSS